MITNSCGAAYFAALNTSDGFVSYFHEIFDKVEKVFVIKGGSGTGKSRFMREVVKAAYSKGYPVEEFYCSSDPTSLDGIIISRLGLAVVDGTSPHIHEPTMIGARERFIDLSVFLDSNSLSAQKEMIASLCKAKSERYSRVYSYMKVISMYDDLIYGLLSKSVDEDKLRKAVAKAMLWIDSKEKGEKRIRIRSAVSTDGEVILNSYAKKAEKRFAVLDVCGLGGLYLSRILKLSEEKGIALDVSYNPYRPMQPDALYFPESRVSFYIGSESEWDENIINMRRFVNDGQLRAYKPEIRSITRLKNAVKEQMNYDFGAIKRLHLALEDIYSGAMNFAEKEKLTARFISEHIK